MSDELKYERRNIVLSGNRYSLRKKPIHELKKLKIVSKLPWGIGNFFVTTIGGIISWAVGTFLGVFFIGAVFMHTRETIVQNIPYLLIYLLGVIILTLELLLTNPSQGSQLLVSIRYLIHKYENSSGVKKSKMINTYSFLKRNIKSNVVMIKDKNIYYMAVYSVKGTISPITFDNQLKMLDDLNRGLLSDLDRDTSIVVSNDISEVNIKRYNMPDNATSDMKRIAEYNFQITKNLSNTQQLKTTVLITSPSETILRERTNSVERRFRQGLVIDYKRLTGSQMKQEVRSFYV